MALSGLLSDLGHDDQNRLDLRIQWYGLHGREIHDVYSLFLQCSCIDRRLEISVVERSQGTMYINLDRMAFQQFSCADRDLVVYNLPLTPVQMSGHLAARSVLTAEQ